MLNANQYSDNMNTITYFTPLYNTEFNFDEYTLAENSSIRKFSDDEKEWFQEFYKDYTPIITNSHNLTHILEIKINLEVEEPVLEANKRISELIKLLRVFKNGDLRIGGLYYYEEAKIRRINYEPIDAYSNKKITIQEQVLPLDEINCIPFENEYIIL